MHTVLELLREPKYSRERVSPFVDLPSLRGAVWLKPRFQAEVSYAEIAGQRLRAPVWLGFMGR